jgi:hypothetical protein
VAPDTGTRILPGAFALHATIRDSLGFLLTRRPIVWTVSDTALLDIGPDTGTDVVVTGKGPGVVRVVASSEGKTDTATFRFVHPSIASLTIIPDTGSFVIPDQPTFNLQALVRDSAGDTLTDRVVTWSVSDSTIASLDVTAGPGINLTGRKAGLVTVAASSAGKVDTARVRVIRPSVSRVQVTPDTVTIVVPAAATLNGVAFDSVGHQLLGRPVRWALLDTAVAAISDSNGDHIDVSGKVGGTARLTASAEGVTDTAIVHVVRPSVARVVFAAPVDTSPVLLRTARPISFQVQDSNGTVLTDRTVAFASSDTNVVRLYALSSNGFLPTLRVTGVGLGTATVSATSETKAADWHAATYSVHYDTVVAAVDESCALTDVGTVYCWRAQGYPHPIANTAGILTITADGHHACGLDAAGTARCWGDNSDGQLGISVSPSHDTAQVVAGGHQFLQIDAGASHTCAVSTSHDAWCWGLNSSGQLGANDLNALEVQPIAVAGGVSFAAVSSGGMHSCGLTSGGAAYCWGSNGFGQLGVDSAGVVSHPIAVTGGHTFTAISAGYTHSCALTAAGAAYCWGDNGAGELGTGGRWSDVHLHRGGLHLHLW